jgi:hypothetical protein
MRQYNRFLVGKTDQFDPGNYLTVDDEIIGINEGTVHLSSSFKGDIIVSFLKDHLLQTEWIKDNPELTDLVSSGSLFTGTIAALFESCRDSPAFRQQLEVYLLKKFSAQ